MNTSPLSLEDLKAIVIDPTSSNESKALCLSLAFEQGRTQGVRETNEIWTQSTEVAP